MKDLWCLRLRTNPILSGSQSPQVIGLCCCNSTSRPCWGCLSDEPFLQEWFQGCHSHLRSIAGVHSAGPEKLVNSSNSCILGYLMSLTLLTAWYSPEFQANFQKEGSILPLKLAKTWSRKGRTGSQWRPVSTKHRCFFFFKLILSFGISFSAVQFWRTRKSQQLRNLHFGHYHHM